MSLKVTIKPLKLKTLRTHTECEFRDFLGFDCDSNLPQIEESHTEIIPYDISKMYTEEGESISDTIINDVGVMSEEEFLKLKEENEILDQKLFEKQFNTDSKLNIDILAENINK